MTVPLKVSDDDEAAKTTPDCFLMVTQQGFGPGETAAIGTPAQWLGPPHLDDLKSYQPPVTIQSWRNSLFLD